MIRSSTTSISTPWSVFKFGSESWGTSCADSDIDIAIGLNFRNTRSDKKYILNKLSQIISENDNDLNLRVKALLNAKYPIICIQHILYKNMKINLSIADRFCAKRDEYIRKYIKYFQSKLNIPIKKFIVFIKYWSKNRGINDSYRGYLNSYGYTLMAIKFILYYVYTHSNNTHYDLAHLVHGFYSFYALKFDETKHSVSIATDSLSNYSDEKHLFDVKYDSNCLYHVLDPVNNQNNVAQNVGYYQAEQIKQEFIRAHQLCTSSSSSSSSSSLFDELTKQKEAVALFDADAQFDIELEEHQHDLDEYNKLYDNVNGDDQTYEGDGGNDGKNENIADVAGKVQIQTDDAAVLNDENDFIQNIEVIEQIDHDVDDILLHLGLGEEKHDEYDQDESKQSNDDIEQNAYHVHTQQKFDYEQQQKHGEHDSFERDPHHHQGNNDYYSYYNKTGKNVYSVNTKNYSNNGYNQQYSGYYYNQHY